MANVTLYPLANYVFVRTDAQPELDRSIFEKLVRLEEYYKEHGMRNTALAVILVHDHGHPHVLLLQVGNSFYKLPGDELAPQTDVVNGLFRKLNDKLGNSSSEDGPKWIIGDCLTKWWRPSYENFDYPYCPPHLTQPKECKSIYLVCLPEKMVLSVPANMQLVAVPLYELYDNVKQYGPILASLPALLSRYTFTFM